VQTPEQLWLLDPVSLGLIVLRTTVVYFALVVGLRLAGKREIGQMTPFDLVVLLIISNAVQNAMIGPDTSLMGGILAAVTLLVLNYTLDRLGLKATWLRSQLVGQPSLLVHQGELIRAHLRAEGITEDEVMQALREHGVDDLHDVKDAILEVDGTISVVPAGAPSSRTRRRIRGRKPVG
jgi:uncharacterized membrane protein YcaP (DUF421 family)